MDQKVLTNILQALEKKNSIQGYVTYDEFLDAVDEYNVPFTRIDFVAEHLNGIGIRLFDHVPDLEEIEQCENPSDSEDVTDYAQIDYEEVYQEILEIDPGLEFLINYIRNIKPAQHGEAAYIFQHMDTYPNAEQRLFDMNIRAAVRTALNESKRSREELADLIQYGAIGILKAIEHYGASHKTPFSGYANTWIFQEMSREISCHGNGCYFPTHVSDELKGITTIVENHACELCSGNKLFCRNLIREVETKYEFNYEKTVRYLGYLRSAISCEELLENEALEIQFLSDGGMFAEQMFEEALHEQSCEAIERALHSLSEKEKNIIKLRNGFGDNSVKTLDECGAVYGVTRERIRQIECKILRKLRYSTCSKKLRGYLPD